MIKIIFVYFIFAFSLIFSGHSPRKKGDRFVFQDFSSASVMILNPLLCQKEM